MTSHKLAAILLAGPDLLVTRRGYEAGAQEITHVKPPTPVHLNCHNKWYYGQHEYCHPIVCHEKDKENHEVPSTLAIHLS